MKTLKVRISVFAVLLTLALGLGAVGTSAQEQTHGVGVEFISAKQVKDSIKTNVKTDLSNVKVGKRRQLRTYPIIIEDRNESHYIPVVVNGSTQEVLEKRGQVLSGSRTRAYATYNMDNAPLPDSINYGAGVKVEPWMVGSRVLIAYDLLDCRGNLISSHREVIADSVDLIRRPDMYGEYNPFIPFIVPPKEDIKNRIEIGEALIVYNIDSDVIKPALGDNAKELNKIRGKISELRDDPNATVHSVNISSYASPEGGWSYNLKLSKKRAASLLKWVKKNTRLNDVALSSDGYGQDWDRLTELLEQDSLMTFREREDILRIIRDTKDPDRRNARIREYNGGRTYKFMLAKYYPGIRRSEYRIEYTVPEFTIEKSREIYKTHPQMLSLAELYALANEYEPGSPEYMDIMKTAYRLFPRDRVANLNMAAASLIAGDKRMAHRVLDSMEENPDALLYLGIMYAKEGNYRRAESYFVRAKYSRRPGAEEYYKEFMEYRNSVAEYEQQMEDWINYGITDK